MSSISLGFERMIDVKGQYRLIERYPVNEPYAYVNIMENTETGSIMYYVDEVALTTSEKRVYGNLLRIIMSELPPPEQIGDVNSVRQFLANKVRELIRKYRRYLRLSPNAQSTLAYYLERDLLGFGPIDPLMRDENIEDISADGVGKPIYVYHKDYESIPTNIVPLSDEAIDDLVVKLIHMADRHVSVATPIVDAQLPDGSRIAVTYRREVSPSGSTFTIRKFRSNPFTFTELVTNGMISPDIAGYFWTMMDYHKSFMVIGVTGAGKTTFLNAMATFIRPNMKIITVEEVPEVKLPHQNWIRLVPRLSFGPQKTSEITMFDLVKATLRMRPDYLIVGEVRGEEAYVLFQAVSTGHGGISTMHAENFDAAKNRLMSPPMNIPAAYIPSMNIFVMIRRIRMIKDGRERVVRRVIEIGEPVLDNGDVKFITVFKWNPVLDRHESYLDRSVLVRDIAEERGVRPSDVIEDIKTRASIVRWMVDNGIKDFDKVARMVELYYNRPEQVLSMVREKATAQPIAPAQR
ncbi:type II/IV secretion system ATPase subunit [Caldivirga maquilingensis]|uniref:Type II secretion system protein E n=1 Tax=Caldivirga maquilingensis (strain ATCC 700844 / DSM 13496 / JCM 10307 / IC-167) TaxID=397948 RepID=A8ME25_CALMQ|nr:type II/IV secretion system ATPase subunit [Caldivirga maquilingensis]ABW02031.1 type II secretion system protein E [Caldivirga maquilingensis IC-167]